MLIATGCSASYAGGATPQSARGIPVLETVDLTVETGELLTIVGRSGSGKSTLLLVLAGLKQPDAGAVTLDGERVGRGDPRVGLVLQHYGLFPWYTVIQNVKLGMKMRGAPEPGAQAERARAMLARVGLAGKEGRYPRELSGGEQQRVALARTLVLEPRLLLLDEPFSALDAITREELQDRLLVLLRDTRTSAVMVTHSLEEAVYLGDRVGVLTGAARAGRAAGPARATEAEPERADTERADTERAGARPPSQLLVIENPAPSRRTDAAYLNACAQMRERFREALHA